MKINNKAHYVIGSEDGKYLYKSSMTAYLMGGKVRKSSTFLESEKIFGFHCCEKMTWDLGWDSVRLFSTIENAQDQIKQIKEADVYRLPILGRDLEKFPLAIFLHQSSLKRI